MGKIKIYKASSKKINEDDVNQNNQQQTQQQPQQQGNADGIRKLNEQILTLRKQIADIEKKAKDDIARINDQILQLQKQIVDLGGSIVETNESYCIDDVQMCLNESYADSEKKELISSILLNAMENSNLSYTFSKKECDNYARYILEEMNQISSSWDKTVDNWDKFLEVLKSYKKIENKYGSSEKEMARLEENLKKSFGVTDNEYSWVFK